MSSSAPRQTAVVSSGQLAFDLPHVPALGAYDFIRSGSNGAALDLIEGWPSWLHWGALVVGPAGAGKTHLCHVWQLKAGAAIVSAPALNERHLETLNSRRALIVEDLHAGIASETVLFHLLNVARQEKLSVLLTSQTSPGDLSISLPDLRSRLRALPLAQIAEPDEMLLRAVLVKLFSDRQLRVDPKVISFLLLRMERSMEAARRVVQRIDDIALQMRRNVTVPLAQMALEMDDMRRDTVT
ncbi:MAG: DnaA/Hda family protein [Pseudomonadota bacterium]